MFEIEWFLYELQVNSLCYQRFSYWDKVKTKKLYITISTCFIYVSPGASRSISSQIDILELLKNSPFPDLINFPPFKEHTNPHRINLPTIIEPQHLLLKRTHNLHHHVDQHPLVHAIQQQDIPNLPNSIKLETLGEEAEHPIENKEFVVDFVSVEEVVELVVALSQAGVDFQAEGGDVGEVHGEEF